ncbi:hypothetical protein [Nannocystis sp. SCPEA4]|uniref:hypothetical protein n=1 Tax=Nannocystis sp. SCPEA4 TaxID=2996787 RepID=UPI0022702330|nr:hypothetical protein [Nannocystis sp. SCPEA4]MCY1059318.1 hypothetical protein [Nannocystis sp. SCPEA4]
MLMTTSSESQPTEPLDPLPLAASLLRCPSVTPAEDGALAVASRALAARGSPAGTSTSPASSPRWPASAKLTHTAFRGTISVLLRRGGVDIEEDAGRHDQDPSPRPLDSLTTLYTLMLEGLVRVATTETTSRCSLERARERAGPACSESPF